MPHKSGLPKSQYPKARKSGLAPKLGTSPGADDFLIQRSRKKVKPPTAKEISGMRQREIIRKNPHKTA